MNVTTQNNLKAFTAQFIEGNLPINQTLKSLAEKIIQNSDFPNSKNESWKYSRLNKIKSLKLKNDTPKEEKRLKQNINKIIISDGSVSALYDHPEVLIQRFSNMNANELLKVGSLIPLENEIFHALNFKYMRDGIFIHVKKNTVVELPICIDFLLNENESIGCPRICVVLEEGSSLQIIHEYIGNAENSLSIPICEYFVGKNASLIVEKIQAYTGNSYLICSDYCKQEKDSRFTINTAFVTGNFVRNNVNISVEGENCETNLNGLIFAKNKEHIDNHTVVNHKVSNCVSNELYKGVLNDQSTSVFNGKIIVHKNAQQINALQSNANILLDERSTVNSKPELEIYANDVKCSHGSTTGQLDNNAIFYLKARGLSENSAKKMMIKAFIKEVIDSFKNLSSREIIKDKMKQHHSL